ncbi:MAG TPA: TRAP transporter substrate-binding protein [Burkholderiales bacterium]|jgi:TRAP-type mannitol/chloroaromatic compound transport system substrate-binding protein
MSKIRSMRSRSNRNAAPGRRQFLRKAATAGGALAAAGLAACGRSEQAAAPAATNAAPAAAPAVILRMQHANPAGDLFFAMGQDFARTVSDLSGGSLTIELLPGGAVVKPFDMADAVHKGTLDGCIAVPAFWYGKNSALSLFGTGPALGHTANTFLSWYERGGGKALYEELYRDVLKLDVVPFLYGPMTTQPLGWFRKEVKSPADFKGLKYRTVGLSVDLFTALGASVVSMPGADIVPALDRGVIDAAEFNNPAVDAGLGLPDVAKNCMVQSYHQPAECFEVLLNRKVFDGLSPQHQAVLRYAPKAASAEMSWQTIDLYSKAYEELRDKRGVKFIETPRDILRAQLDAWDKVIEQKGAENAFFRKVLDSQKAYMKRVVGYQLKFEVPADLAYEHFFGKA